MSLFVGLSGGLLLPHVFTCLTVLFLLRTLFKFLAKYTLSSISEIREETWHNVVSSVFYLITLLFSVAFGEYISRGTIWRENNDHCFTGYPDEIISWGMKAYYTYSISFYLFSVVCLFLDEKKKDFTAMLVHHLVTIFLVGASAAGGMHRIGIIIMLSFDKSDILLEAAKICNRMKLHNCAATFFVFFVASWINFRVYSYPVYVLSSASRAEMLAGHSIPYYNLCFASLVVIWALQMYWSWFIVKKVIVMAKKGVTAGDDPREATFKEHQK